MRKRQFTHLLCTCIMAVYLLGIHDGKVALWRGEDPEPMKIFPYSASLLPDAERQRLRQGIRIESMEDLNKLIEAYLS